MIRIEQEIFYDALRALQNKLRLHDEDIVLTSKDNSNIIIDAVIQILGVEFICEIKNHISTVMYNRVLSTIRDIQRRDDRPILIIARYISPIVFDEFVKEGINILDCAGNCHIRYEKNGVLIFHLGHTGEKNIYAKEVRRPVFQTAGIKLIFYLLHRFDNIDKPYRQIQEETGLSLGTIKNVIDELVYRHYVLLTDNGRRLKNKRKLLDLWVENYNQYLKPKLLLDTMDFRTVEHNRNWQNMKLPDGAYWGGESGAYLMDPYLTPGRFEIYTEVPATYLLQTGFVRYDIDGDIRVYKKFWEWNAKMDIAPSILIYADLMGSGNSRCLEMAERLLENELGDFK